MSEKISLKVDREIFRFWENINVNLSLDSMDTFDFTTPLRADDIKFREIFAPARYPVVEVLLNDEIVLSGVLSNKKTALASKTLSLGGYSKPGILNDLPVPPDKYPLEFNNQTLVQIAREMAGYYGVATVFDGSPGAAFPDAVSPDPAEKILAFLIKLAHKRNVLVGNDAAGNLKFFSPARKTSVTPLRQGELPLLDVQVDFNEQQMFSSVTGFGAAEVGRDPERFTVEIPALSGLRRPFVYTVSDAQGAELQSAVKFKAGRLFANSMKISASVLGWRNANGARFSEGDFISLYCPGNFFYTETELMVRNVRLMKSGSDETTGLDLVFAGSYSGELPAKLPWE